MSTVEMSSQSSVAFGRNVGQILKEYGISQSELARQCEWPPARVNDIVHGRSDHYLGTVEKVAKVLSSLTGSQIDIQDLLADAPAGK